MNYISLPSLMKKSFYRFERSGFILLYNLQLIFYMSWLSFDKSRLILEHFFAQANDLAIFYCCLALLGQLHNNEDTRMYSCWNCNPWLGFGVAHKGILCKKTFALTRFANNRILSRRVAHKGILWIRVSRKPVNSRRAQGYPVNSRRAQSSRFFLLKD